MQSNKTVSGHKHERGTFLGDRLWGCWDCEFKALDEWWRAKQALEEKHIHIQGEHMGTSWGPIYTCTGCERTEGAYWWDSYNLALWGIHEFGMPDHDDRVESVTSLHVGLPRILVESIIHEYLMRGRP